MSNRVVKAFTVNSSWVCPANVTHVEVQSIKKPMPFNEQFSVIDCQGNIWAWGTNAKGQLGLNDVIDRSVPTLLPFVSGQSWQKVVSTMPEVTNASGGFSIGFTEGGSFYTWGNNTNAQLCTGDQIPRSTPTLIGDVIFQEVFVTSSSNTSLSQLVGAALGINNDLYIWGNNANGQLGLGDVVPRSNATVVPGIKFSQAAFSYDTSGGPTFQASSFGIDMAGALYSWGFNTNGELGLNDRIPRSTPTLVAAAPVFTKIYSNTGSTFGLTAAGALYAWGLNGVGQLGLGDVLARSSPVAVSGGLVFDKIIQLNQQTLNSSVLGITTSGALYAWGRNNNGQLGLGDVLDRSTPTLVSAGPFVAFSATRSGAGNAFFVLAKSGVLYGMGGNLGGALGVGDVLPRSTPTVVTPPSGQTWMAVHNPNSLNAGCTFAVASDGQLYSWGGNQYGNLGVGDVVDRSTPTLVSLTTRIDLRAKVTAQDITVVPGTTYAIKVGRGQAQAIFGMQVVGIRNPDEVRIIYST